jgi:hypothetical protein
MAHDALTALGASLRRDFQTLSDEYIQGWLEEDHLTVSDWQALRLLEIDLYRLWQIGDEFLTLATWLTSGFIPTNLFDPYGEASAPSLDSAPSRDGAPSPFISPQMGGSAPTRIRNQDIPGVQLDALDYGAQSTPEGGELFSAQRPPQSPGQQTTIRPSQSLTEKPTDMSGSKFARPGLRRALRSHPDQFGDSVQTTPGLSSEQKLDPPSRAHLPHKPPPASASSSEPGSTQTRPILEPSSSSRVDIPITSPPQIETGNQPAPVSSRSTPGQIQLGSETKPDPIEQEIPMAAEESGRVESSTKLDVSPSDWTYHQNQKSGRVETSTKVAIPTGKESSTTTQISARPVQASPAVVEYHRVKNLRELARTLEAEAASPAATAQPGHDSDLAGHFTGSSQSRAEHTPPGEVESTEPRKLAVPDIQQDHEDEPTAGPDRLDHSADPGVSSTTSMANTQQPFVGEQPVLRRWSAQPASRPVLTKASHTPGKVPESSDPLRASPDQFGTSLASSEPQPVEAESLSSKLAGPPDPEQPIEPISTPPRASLSPSVPELRPSTAKDAEWVDTPGLTQPEGANPFVKTVPAAFNDENIDDDATSHRIRATPLSGRRQINQATRAVEIPSSAGSGAHQPEAPASYQPVKSLQDLGRLFASPPPGLESLSPGQTRIEPEQSASSHLLQQGDLADEPSPMKPQTPAGRKAHLSSSYEAVHIAASDQQHPRPEEFRLARTQAEPIASIASDGSVEANLTTASDGQDILFKEGDATPSKTEDFLTDIQINANRPPERLFSLPLWTPEAPEDQPLIPFYPPKEQSPVPPNQPAGEDAVTEEPRSLSRRQEDEAITAALQPEVINRGLNRPDDLSEIDLDLILEALAQEIQREYKRFYGS